MPRKSTRIESVCEHCQKRFSLPGYVYRGRMKKQSKHYFCSRHCRTLFENSIPLAMVFAERVGETTATGCILWKGTRTSGGYGQLVYHRTLLLAHRVAYRLAFGDFDESLGVLHRCDNRLCVNAEHLFLGTNADNVRDMVSKGRHPHGETNGQSRLTASQVTEIRRLHAQGEKLKKIASAYGIKQDTVVRIVGRRLWKHV